MHCFMNFVDANIEWQRTGAMEGQFRSRPRPRPRNRPPRGLAAHDKDTNIGNPQCHIKKANSQKLEDFFLSLMECLAESFRSWVCPHMKL